MEDKIVFFDVDDTLISKKEFKANLNQNLANECGKSSEEISEHMENYINGLEHSDDFDIDNYIGYIEKKYGQKIAIEKYLSNELKIYSNAVFPDAFPALTELKNKFRLGVFTQGTERLQSAKIKSSGLEDYFEKSLIYISKDKLSREEIDKMPAGSTIIDDKKLVVEKLKSFEDEKHFNIIWINRNNDEKIDGVTTVKNLGEVLNLIDSQNLKENRENEKEQQEKSKITQAA